MKPVTNEQAEKILDAVFTPLDAGSPKPESPWDTTQRLRDEAIKAVIDLSTHLEKVPDKPRMYIANQAIHKLWEIE